MKTEYTNEQYVAASNDATGQLADYLVERVNDAWAGEERYLAEKLVEQEDQSIPLPGQEWSTEIPSQYTRSGNPIPVSFRIDKTS